MSIVFNSNGMRSRLAGDTVFVLLAFTQQVVGASGPPLVLPRRPCARRSPSGREMPLSSASPGPRSCATVPPGAALPGAVNNDVFARSAAPSAAEDPTGCAPTPSSRAACAERPPTAFVSASRRLWAHLLQAAASWHSLSFRCDSHLRGRPTRAAAHRRRLTGAGLRRRAGGSRRSGRATRR